MDHLSSNILMCAMLLLFYASGTVEGVGFGNACSDTNTCDGDHIGCISLECACISTAYKKKNTDTCALKVALGEACTDEGVPAAQCIDDLAECTNNGGFKCSCKDGNYKSGDACKVKVAIGDTCDKDDTATDQCSVTYTACSDDGDGANKCLCTSTYYQSGSTCNNKVALGEACTADGVPAGQCTDDLAECTNNGGFKCSCKDGNYKSGTECKAEVAIGGTCDIADTSETILLNK